MKRFLAVALILNAMLLAVRTWQELPVAQGATGPATDRRFCADPNGDGIVDLSDAVTILNFLFIGGSPGPCCMRNSLPRGRLPATGQTNCFGADPLGIDPNDHPAEVLDCNTGEYPGQDGASRSGCPYNERFIDNGDGTLTDTCAGLMWQKDRGDFSAGHDWQGALHYCDALDLGGHRDWRLPNIQELQSLLDFSRLGPSAAPIGGPGITGSTYWSSTTEPYDVSPEEPHAGAWRALVVTFAIGHTYGQDKNFTGYNEAIAVRDLP